MATSERIKHLREKQLLLTQTELAQLLHVESVTVSRWERGVVEPKFSNLRALAHLASVPFSYFFEDAA